MKKLIQIAAIGMLPLLAGCFDLEQGLSVDSSGTATYSTEIAIDTETLNMLAAFGEGDPESPCADIDSDAIPETFTVTSEEFERDGDTVCRTVAVGPIDDLIDSVAAIAAQDDDQTIMLIDEGGGVYAFTSTIVSEDAELEEFGDPEIMDLFEGRTMTFSVTAPVILETNGDVDGNTSSLVVPTIDLMTDTGTEYTLFVRFRL